MLRRRQRLRVGRCVQTGTVVGRAVRLRRHCIEWERGGKNTFSLTKDASMRRHICRARAGAPR
jgi:hypothetical protein